MPCPTCDHTMHQVKTGTFWCPRCGTMKSGDDIGIPRVVQRCRSYAITNPPPSVWRRLGIAESINLPDKRA